MKTDFKADIAAVRAIAAVPAILDVVCRTTGMGFAAVARVTENRWITCASIDQLNFGLKPGDELKVETTICHEIRQSREAVVIDEVAEHPQYCGHLTPAMYGFQSYISMPIILEDGSFWGTLCAIDPKPARLNTPEVVGMFKLFAELIGLHLVSALKVVETENRLSESERLLAATEASLTDERKTSELREQFIAVLGHDLRNPLASIDAGARMLQRAALDARSASILTLMRQSILRIAAMVDNVMDFARGRLGGGITLTRRDVDLAPALEQVVDELSAVYPERRIDAEIDLRGTVNGDETKLAQLFSNLLANALAYGSDDEPIRVRASIEEGSFVLLVANAGPPIDPDAMRSLFKPYRRAAKGANETGLGLGLYIASEVAGAHGGRLDATSTEQETRFVFRMPVA